MTTGFHAITRASIIIYRYFKSARWPRVMGTTAWRLAKKIVRHPKKAVPISVFGGVALILLTLPFLCSEPERQVTVTLTNLPEGATVYYDDDAMNENPFSVSVKKSPSEIRVEAKGKRPFTKKIVPTKNRTIQVVLNEEKKTKDKPQKRETAKSDEAPTTEKAEHDRSDEGTEETKATKKSGRRRIRWRNPFRRSRKSAKKNKTE